MASGEKLLERGVRLKTVKPKNRSVQPVKYWSPNYLGRVYQAKSEGGGVDRHQRPHWRKGHLKSQPYGRNCLCVKSSGSSHIAPEIGRRKLLPEFVRGAAIGAPSEAATTSNR
jgi:hypothetical protein